MSKPGSIGVSTNTKLHVPNPQPINDAFIAATALVHGMTVATRNLADFATMGVPLLNPWDERP
jgi:predicted nucleic acid-binding protein